MEEEKLGETPKVMMKKHLLREGGVRRVRMVLEGSMVEGIISGHKVTKHHETVWGHVVSAWLRTLPALHSSKLYFFKTVQILDLLSAPHPQNVVYMIQKMEVFIIHNTMTSNVFKLLFVSPFLIVFFGTILQSAQWLLQGQDLEDQMGCQISNPVCLV